jgi:ATP/maltotriose-dependent transcriptional regulator MalT
VTELRAAQLRFTEYETSELLHQLSGAQPDPTYVAQLFQDTEGWPIALQLAALVQQTSPPRTNLAEVKHQLAEYLAEEVFAQQPAALQQALLAFAVPERFCAELGAALHERSAALPWPTFDGDLAIVRGTVLYLANSAPAEVMDVLWCGLRLGAVPSLAASALAFLARTYAAAGRYDEGVRLLTDLSAVAPDVSVQIAPLVRHTALCMVHEFVGRIDDLAREAQHFTATLAATQPPGTWALFAAAFRARAAYEQTRLDAAAADFVQVRARNTRQTPICISAA